MPRIRTVKPEFWTSEQVVNCCIEARLMFVGLWNFCDDAGIHPASSRRLLMEVFPGDNIKITDVDAWVNELLSNQLLIEYEAEGKLYWQVTGWSHQKIDKPNRKYPVPTGENRKSPTIPGAVADHSASTRLPFDERSTSDRLPFDDSSTTIPLPLDDHSTTPRLRKGKGREKEKEEIRQVADATRPVSVSADDSVPTCDDQVKAVFAHWQAVMNHPKAKLDKKRKAKITQTLQDFSKEDLCKAVDGCKATVFNMGGNDRKQVYDSIDLIFRDAEHIERFMATADNPVDISSTGDDDIFTGAL